MHDRSRRPVVLSAASPQRLGPLIHLPALLGEFGVPLADALEGTDLAPSLFADPEQRIPYRVAGQILERSTVLSGCPHFGLLLGSRCDHSALGLPGQWMANSPTLGLALSGLASFQGDNSRGAAGYLHRSGEHWVIGYGIYEPRAVAQDQIYPLVIALVLNAIKSLTGGAVGPVEILFSTRKPPDVGPYRRLLCDVIRFDQTETGIVFPAAALDAPVRNADPEELERLRQRIATERPDSATPWTDRVRRALRPQILRGEPTSSELADILGIGLRTLARRLEREGTSYQKLVDGVRYTMACELLEFTQLSVGEVAEALSYAQQSNFGKAFSNWTGMSPNQWRVAIHSGRLQQIC
jgi:AraC-like DNA-binding protein